MSVMAITSSVAFRDKRLIPSGVVKESIVLQYAPAAGLDGVLGEKAKDGRVRAAPTQHFGERFVGKYYSADKVFEPEMVWPLQSKHVKAERELKFTIITLYRQH